MKKSLVRLVYTYKAVHRPIDPFTIFEHQNLQQDVSEAHTIYQYPDLEALKL